MCSNHLFEYDVCTLTERDPPSPGGLVDYGRLVYFPNAARALGFVRSGWACGLSASHELSFASTTSGSRSGTMQAEMLVEFRNKNQGILAMVEAIASS